MGACGGENLSMARIAPANGIDCQDYDQDAPGFRRKKWKIEKCNKGDNK